MQSPKLFKSPKKTITPKKEESTYVYLLRLDFPEQEPLKVTLPKTMDLLLKEATTALQMLRPAKVVYDEAGYQFEDIESIPPKAMLYVSAVPVPTEEKRDEIYGKPKIPAKELSYWQRLELPIIKRKPPKPAPANKEIHMQIGSRTATVKDNVRDSLMALYSVLTPQHKSQLACADELKKLTNNAQLYFLQHAMLSQFIGPTMSISGTQLGQETAAWIMEKFEGIKVSECRFCFLGPYQSGKSTLLEMAVLLFFQKLQLCAESHKYLIVPINWKLQQIVIDDLSKVFTAYAVTTIQALKAARPKMYPIVDELQRWFLSLMPLKGFPPLPPGVRDFDDFPVEPFTSFAQQIHKAWNKKSGLRNFVELMTRIPQRFANIFGFEDAVLVYDHFDASGFMLEDRDRFPESDPVSLAEILSASLEECPFFVASLNDEEFHSLFQVDNCQQFSTERIITKAADGDIIVTSPALTVKMEMCQGCPGYCALYRRVYDMAQKAHDHMAIKLPSQTRFKSVVDCTRRNIVMQEFMRLCLLLEGIKDENLFDRTIMNELAAKREFEVRVR